MNLFTIVRIVAILFGALTAVHLARSGFDLLLDDVLKAIIDRADDFLKVVMVVIDPAIQGVLRSLRDWGFVVPDLLDHWRQVFVLMLLFFGAYVREITQKDAPARTLFLAGWATVTALVSSVAAGTANFEDVQLFIWPALGFFVFFVGARFWDAMSVSSPDDGVLQRIGVSGVVLMLCVIVLVVITTQESLLWTIREWNTRAIDAVPSPGMLALMVSVLSVGIWLAVFGLPHNGRESVDAAINPGRSVGLSILAAFSAAALGITLSRADRITEPLDDAVAPKMVRIDPRAALPAIDVIAVDKATDGSTVSASRTPKQPYWLSATEISKEQFGAFVAAEQYVVKGNCNQSTNESGSYRGGAFGNWKLPRFQAKLEPAANEYNEKHPVVCVSLADARAFARWLSDKTGQRYRIPSEDEWRYALRDGLDDSHSDEWICTRDNFSDPKCPDPWKYTAPAGSFPANTLGLHDLVGNVREWTESCMETVTGASHPWDWALTGGCRTKIVVGGGWGSDVGYARYEVFTFTSAAERSNDIGFRVARDD